MNDINKVLIVEDSSEIVEALTITLQMSWPNIKVLSTGSGREALKIFEAENPGIVLLDLCLTDMNGFEVLKEIRRLSTSVTVIIITVRGDESDVVIGLELGADEYIIKPFRQMELIARIRNILRRKYHDSGISSVVNIGNMQFNPGEQTLLSEGKKIELTRIENIILLTLVNNPNILVTYDRMAEAVWGNDYPEAPSALRVHVYRLRHKIEKDPAQPKIITTKEGLGYIFADPSAS